MDIPAWMFDRAQCAAMKGHESIPYVHYEKLRDLRQLIHGILASGSLNQVEQEHSPLPQEGNAHEKKKNTSALSRATEPVRRKTKATEMGRSSTRSAKANKRSHRSDLG
jgi:hypothetical protein